MSFANDPRILAILEAPLLPGETHVDAFRRKEHSLAEIFAVLTPVESLHLERRLANPAPGDALAARFASLVPDRRNRLLMFLAGTRQRRPVTAASSLADARPMAAPEPR